VEQLVQPAHGAVLSRHHRQCVFRTEVYGAQQKAVPWRPLTAAIMAKLLSRLASHRIFGVWLIAIDPLDPNILYGDWLTRTKQDIGGIREGYAGADSARRISLYADATGGFSPLEPHTLYFGRRNVLFKTTDAGNSWQVISPDLTRETYELPRISAFRGERSRKKANTAELLRVAPSF